MSARHLLQWKRGLACTLLLCPWMPRTGAMAAGGAVLRYHFTVGGHFSEVETLKTTIIRTTKSGTKTSMLVETTPFTVTAAKVYADGSTDLRVTFGTATSTSDGKTFSHRLDKVYQLFHISAIGKVLSHKTVGEDMASTATYSLPDLTPSTYPVAAIAPGGTWMVRQKDSDGTTELHRLVALGSHNGRPTATVHVTYSAPAQDGMATGSQDSQFYIDTGEDLVPSQLSAKLTGSSGSGDAATTYTYAVTGTITPQA